MSLLELLVLFFAAVSLMRCGARATLFFHGYDAGRKSIREEHYGPGDDATAAIFNLIFAAFCVAALIGRQLSS